MNAYVWRMMQAAVDVVSTSPHPVNKIAASLRGRDDRGRAFALSRTNLWPEPISRNIGHGTDIGNSSGTIHAEIACLLAATHTQGAELFITDPPCPNCVKAMAEAGIRRLYIDHKGFDKDFALRRGWEFENLSLKLCREAGIGVYEVRRKERLCRCLQKGRRAAPSLHTEGFLTMPCKAEDMKAFRAQARAALGDHPMALALAEKDGETHGLAVCALTFASFSADPARGKYTPVLEPITRLLMTARREGMILVPGTLHSSRIPTAREMVNMVGAGLSGLSIGDMNSARDIFGPIALKQLTEHKIITVIEGN